MLAGLNGIVAELRLASPFSFGDARLVYQSVEIDLERATLYALAGILGNQSAASRSNNKPI